MRWARRRTKRNRGRRSFEAIREAKVKSYFIKISGREDGPFPETQIAQMFADQRVNRSTPCKPEFGGDWRTIDDYLPTLKYGTQLPSPATATSARLSAPSHTGVSFNHALQGQAVTIVDVDIPFWSVVKILFKWMGATLADRSVCFPCSSCGGSSRCLFLRDSSAASCPVCRDHSR